jgi:hypothetical protein
MLTIEVVHSSPENLEYLSTKPAIVNTMTKRGARITALTQRRKQGNRESCETREGSNGLIDCVYQRFGVWQGTNTFFQPHTSISLVGEGLVQLELI